MRDWSFGFPFPKSSGNASAVTDATPIASETETVTPPPVIVPYARFLERRAWREKIAADFHQAKGQCIDIEAIRSEALGAEAIPPRH